MAVALLFELLLGCFECAASERDHASSKTVSA